MNTATYPKPKIHPSGPTPIFNVRDWKKQPPAPPLPQPPTKDLNMSGLLKLK